MAKTSKEQQRRFFNSADEHQKAIVQILRELSRAHGLERTWSDWTEMSALALANAVDRAQFEKREKRYLEIVGHYGKEDLQQLAEAFAHLVQCSERRAIAGEFGDVLGSTFMMLDVGNSGTGQFSTPYEVSRLMGAMILGDGQELAGEVGRRGFLRLMEPACGAGGMLICWPRMRCTMPGSTTSGPCAWWRSTSTAAACTWPICSSRCCTHTGDRRPWQRAHRRGMGALVHAGARPGRVGRAPAPARGRGCRTCVACHPRPGRSVGAGSPALPVSPRPVVASPAISPAARGAAVAGQMTLF